eukprot:6698602-Ditylum_brightwellii.AAC.1
MSIICDRFTREAALIRLNSALYQQCTAPVIKETIIYHIAQYWNLPYKPYPIPYDIIGQTLPEAFNEQCSLDRLHFIKGQILSKWIKVHQLYYQSVAPDSTKYNNTKWSKALVIALWDMFESIWYTQSSASHGTLFCKVASSHLDTDIKFAYSTLHHQMMDHDAQLFLTPFSD